MHALAPLALFLATAAASPKPGHNLIPRATLAGMTVAEAQGSCGSNQEVSCCNEATNEGDNQTEGLLGGLLNGLLGDGLLGQCSGLDLSIIGITGLLGDHCQGSVACCDNAPPAASGGVSLINLQLPCIALGSLL